MGNTNYVPTIFLSQMGVLVLSYIEKIIFSVKYLYGFVRCVQIHGFFSQSTINNF